jgi:hypothetical protein
VGVPVKHAQVEREQRQHAREKRAVEPPVLGEREQHGGSYGPGRHIDKYEIWRMKEE